MASYNDLTFNNGPYVPQYAGAPLQEIADTASQLSERHYSNLARLNQIQLLREQAKSKVLPGAKEYIDTQFKDIDEALAEIAKTGGENSTARVSAIANRFLGDQGVLRATEQASEYQKFLQTQRDLKRAGKSPVYNKKLEQSYLNSPVMDPETGKLSSVYNDPFKLQAEGYIEPVPEIDKLWSVIQPDAFESVLGKKDYLMLSKLIPQAVENGAIDMPMFYEMVKKSGIDEAKIRKFTEAVKRQVDSSDVGRQAREFGTVTPQQMDDLILQRGLMRVYNNIDRSVVQSGVTDDILKGAGATAPSGLKTPLPAKVREKIDPGFKMGQIDEHGKIAPTWWQEAINDVTDSFKPINAPDTGDATTKERTQNMLSYVRTAMEANGQDSSGLDDKQVQAIAATPNGQKMLKDYLDNIAGQRYHSPYINNIVDEKVRQANEDFLRGNYSQREFIDMATGEHYTSLKNEDGEVREDLLDLSLALQQKKAIVEGNVDPKHIYTNLAADGDNFVRGLRVQVPVGDKGEMREFLVSQPIETTSTQDVNENVLYNAATEAPGRWADIGRDMKVMTAASDPQKELLWNKYGYNTGLMKEQFMGSDIVIIGTKDGDKIFPNYTVAAKWLADNKGIKLAKQKKK